MTIILFLWGITTGFIIMFMVYFIRMLLKEWIEDIVYDAVSNNYLIRTMNSQVDFLTDEIRNKRLNERKKRK